MDSAPTENAQNGKKLNTKPNYLLWWALLWGGIAFYCPFMGVYLGNKHPLHLSVPYLLCVGHIAMCFLLCVWRAASNWGVTENEKKGSPPPQFFWSAFTESFRFLSRPLVLLLIGLMVGPMIAVSIWMDFFQIKWWFIAIGTLVIPCSMILIMESMRICRLKNGREFEKPFKVEELCALDNLAWIILSVSTVSVAIPWLCGVESHYSPGDSPQLWNPDYFNPMITDFFRFLLISSVALFIGKMYKRHEDFHEKADEIKAMLSQFDGVPHIARQARTTLEQSLSVVGTVNEIFPVTLLSKKLKNSSRGRQTGKHGVVMEAYTQCATQLKQFTVNKLGKFITDAEDICTDDHAKVLVALEAVETSLSYNDGWREGENPTPTLRTWFPHYAAMVRRITESLLEYDEKGEANGRFEFYATIPLRVNRGLSSFFNIGNSGADPLWSIEFLNEFLWKLPENTQYRRIFLYGKNKADFEQHRLACSDDLNSDKGKRILCCAFGDRLKAIALPTDSFYCSLPEALKNKYSQDISPPFFSEIVQKFDSWDQDNEQSRGKVRFICLDSSIITSQKIDEAKRLIEDLNKNGNKDSGLSFEHIFKVINEYPPGENKKWVIDDDKTDASNPSNSYLVFNHNEFDELFPRIDLRTGFNDLFSVWDNNLDGDDKWLACIAVKPEEVNIETCMAKVYVEGLAAGDEWRDLKVTLNNLFNNSNRISKNTSGQAQHQPFD
jgi:hypothetical protein